MASTILKDTKKLLGIADELKAFDTDVTIHINSALATLKQLGVARDREFVVETGEETWDQLLDDDVHLQPVKSYIYFRVRLAFDPPPTAYSIQSFEKQAQELEWRLNVYAESEAYND